MAVSRLAALALACAVTFGPAPGASQTAAARPLASSHHAVSTTVDAAQAAFDRGLALTYAFSVGEARSAFKAAAKSDPALAMAPWGEALVETIDINLAQTNDGDKRARRAIARAVALERGASPQERGLIDALAKRYTVKGTVTSRYVAYAHAMTLLAAGSRDADVLTLAAYADWNAVDYPTSANGKLTPGGQRIDRDLNSALTLDPTNLGARHLRIHFSEVIGHPRRALADARYLDSLDFSPGMSHLPHMAGHIYARVGDYPALVAANRRAIANDAAFDAMDMGPGQMYMKNYHDHDLEFVLYGLTTQGLNAEAAAAVAKEDANERLHLALRTHDAAAALELVRGPGKILAPYRAIALARNGRVSEARALLQAKDGNGFARTRAVVAQAEIARASGDLDAAAAAYRRALKLIGSDLGDPKNFWFVPPGESLGAVLLQAHRYAQAETVFRGELTRFPNDPRLAYGLAEALLAQRRDDTAERALAHREWHGVRPLRRSDLG